jgi:hypothetical protein
MVFFSPFGIGFRIILLLNPSPLLYLLESFLREEFCSIHVGGRLRERQVQRSLKRQLAARSSEGREASAECGYIVSIEREQTRDGQII